MTKNIVNNFGGKQKGMMTIRDTAKRDAATGYGNVESTSFTNPEPKSSSQTKKVKRLNARMHTTNLLAILSVMFWTINVRY
jgi:hypothetical protein